ncbi:germination protein, Ger(x)C family [Paenibacillus sp. 1_12]|uniref:Ger(x)C family spore germination protein n=1 Tax=Paenibacillus sp. 1_12 TaxID=1566278 RepID=UPI0008DFD7C7|nr:Ger(x)C family spore germination protein [Paenibacillus sp. 1_12]SFM17502.1 germination protein, Ger(x)C family [Paenibacillus sp. 1_12]
MTSGDKRKRWIPCLLVIVLALTACSSQRIVDQINILMILGLDKSDNGFKGTGLYSDFNHGEKLTLLQGTAAKPTLLLNKMNNQSPQPVEIAKLEMILFDKQLAEDGISPFIETIFKDPLISNYLIVAVSEGATASMLETLVDKKGDSLPYHIIKQNIQSGGIPDSNLHTLLFDYYGEGRDMSVPYLTLNPGGKIALAGYAIFKDEHLKLIINQEELPLYTMLHGNLRGDVPFTIRTGQNKGMAVFSSIYGKESRSVSKSINETKVIYNMMVNGMVKDYPKWTDLRDEGNVRELILQLEKQMSSKLAVLLNKFVKEKVDPFGVGDLVRAHSRDWCEKEFYEVEYPKIKFEVNLKVHLSKSGT